jgi:SAM-dependent methyltransferase
MSEVVEVNSKAREAAIVTACRACGAAGLEVMLSLGRTPLANRLLLAEDLTEPEPTYPLDLAFCSECALAQITVTVPPEDLFREYFYLSSFSDTMLRHANDIAARLIPERKLSEESLVVEIASNDGYLLQYYKERGISVLGIEPAVNIARIARDERGIPTVCEFFDEALARELRESGKRADIIHANNVLAHVVDLNSVVRGIAVLLSDTGVAVIEVPYVGDLIDHCEFDTIYHEHLCYFSLTTLNHLFRRHNLIITDVEHLPIHGGSLRVFAAKTGHQDERVAGGSGQQSTAVVRMLKAEKERGMDSSEFYRKFAANVEGLRSQLLEMLNDFKREGKRIAAYGASAKGSTLLNYFGINGQVLDFVVDRSTVKQGHYTPGTHLLIFAPEKLLEEMPDYVLLLTWNFADEILDQQMEFRRRGGRFIIPIPELRLV